MTLSSTEFPPRRFRLPVLLLSPVVVIFVSSNVVNAGNLLFNLLFSRWMGPAAFGELATLLTLKLALLGALGAVQFAVSQRIAADEGSFRAVPLAAALGHINKIAFIGLWMVLPLVLLGAWSSGVTETLGLSHVSLLLVLAASLPFAVPLSILRGVAFGRLASREVLLSANIEMLVRLVAASIAWHLGFGLPGVVASVSLSIVAGWVPLTHLLPKAQPGPDWDRVGVSIAAAAVPFVLLQLGQVILLDGDVVLARILVDAEASGYVAALSLFQRIQFFACFGLAGVLLPAVTRAVARNEPVLASAISMLGLFGLVSLTVLVCVTLFPEALVKTLVGPAFLPASGFLLPIAMAAVFFTLSYLVATFLHAIGDARGVWLFAIACPVQVIGMFLAGSDLQAIIFAKLGCQAGLLTLLLTCAVLRLRQNTKTPNSTSFQVE